MYLIRVMTVLAVITVGNASMWLTRFAEKGLKKSHLNFLLKDLRHPDSICLLSSEAYQYYLPALLLLIVEYQGQNKLGDWEIWPIYGLQADEPESQYYDFTVEGYKIFNNQQKHVIRLFLEYLIDADPNEYGDEDSPPKEALKNYWDQW